MFKHKKVILSNKMPMILVPIAGAKTATVLVMVRTGSKYETARESGLSHFLEHMFFKGTTRRPNTFTLSAELDVLGSDYNAFTSKEYTLFYVKVMPGKLIAAIDILGDMLSASKFEAREIERERGVIIEEIKGSEDNPSNYIYDVLEACLYGDTPAGRDIAGTKKTVKGLTRTDFLRYFKRQYGAQSMTVILAGAFKDSDRAAVARTFGSFPNNNWKDKEPVKENQKRPAVKIAEKDIDQVNIAVAVRTYPADHPLEIPLKLLGIILGGSMSSRLFISLRERSSLAYFVRTFSDHYSDTGYLCTQAGVPKDRLDEAIRIILSEYRRIAIEEVPSAELARAKDIYSGHIAMQLESSDDIANWYAHQTILNKRLYEPEMVEKKLRAITSADIREAAGLVMKESGLNLAIVGPVKKKEQMRLRKLLKFEQ